MYKIMDCVMGVMQTYLKEKYKKNTYELYINYNLMEFRFDREIKKSMIKEGYGQFMTIYREKNENIKDTESVSTNTDNVSEHNVDDVIRVIKNEITVNENIIDIEKIVNSS